MFLSFFWENQKGSHAYMCYQLRVCHVICLYYTYFASSSGLRISVFLFNKICNSFYGSNQTRIWPGKYNMPEERNTHNVKLSRGSNLLYSHKYRNLEILTFSWIYPTDHIWLCLVLIYGGSKYRWNGIYIQLILKFLMQLKNSSSHYSTFSVTLSISIYVYVCVCAAPPLSAPLNRWLTVSRSESPHKTPGFTGVKNNIESNN